MEKQVSVLFCMVICFLPLPICFAQDADKALPAITPQIPQNLLPQSVNTLFTPLPAERKKGDRKATENLWYSMVLGSAVPALGMLVPGEKKDDCWARYQGKYYDRCLSADEWRTGKNAD